MAGLERRGRKRPASVSLVDCLLGAKAAAAEVEERRVKEAASRARQHPIPTAPVVTETRRPAPPPLPPEAPPVVERDEELVVSARRARDIDAAISRFLSWGAGWSLPLHRKQRARVAGRTDVWKVFSRQEAAFSWVGVEEEAGRGAQSLRFFSVETGENARRLFIVATHQSFWAKYRAMDPHKRHHYELIRQGWPCHIYFDLEYLTAPNPDLDGDAMVDALLAATEAVLKRRYELPDEWRIAPDWVIELDSTSDRKFSRHLVLQLHSESTPIAFRSNAHVGEIVREAVEVVSASAEGLMLVRKDEESNRVTPFVDMAVYTRNRVFRLVHSSKCGKVERLLPTERFANRGGKLKQKEVYLRSLVCNVPPDAAVLDAFDERDDAPASAQQRQRQKVSGSVTAAAARGGEVGRSGSGGGPAQPPSPFPDVDRFIESVCSQGGVRGYIRSWMMLEEANLLVLNIRNNRWCGNVGRAHKSNGVFYVVDFQSGCWFQKCYDLECRHYRSAGMPLPPGLAPTAPGGQQVREGEEGALLNDGDNGALIEALEEYEMEVACLKAVEELETAPSLRSPPPVVAGE